VDNNSVTSSSEFNGDMYSDGFGDDVLTGLAYDVTDFNSFVKFVENFNSENFGYEEELIYDVTHIFFDNDEKTLIDFRNDYFKRFGSDYIFIKNNSDKNIEIIDAKNGKHFTIESGHTRRFNFGHVNNTFF